MRHAKSGLALGILLTVAVLVGPVATPSAQGQTFTTLHNFHVPDGAFPGGALLQATDGNLYGATAAGGANKSCSVLGCGTVFKIIPSGRLTTLYSFCAQSNCTDGESPVGSLVQATDGNFYGETYLGGTGSACPGCGTIFKINRVGTLTTLYSFCSQNGCTDGTSPFGGLVQASDGNFYGTTAYGGYNNCGTGGTFPGCGTVFKITPSGRLTTLYSFCSQGFGCTDGANPLAGLVQATDGNLYGTTSNGGASTIGGGTVFKITTSGTLTRLWSFCQEGSMDGCIPSGGLIQATDGNLYGTTPEGGANSEGTVFRITTTGTLTTLYSFCPLNGCPDGQSPGVGLVQATDGNFYGTTRLGGANGVGTVFTITPSGTLTTLYSFCSQSGCADGDQPRAALVQETNGTLYGTTYQGGSGTCMSGCGTVFSLSVGLGPFVETQTTSGKVGASVKILGTNLTGATSVSFNGTAATFTVVSSSLITTTVPAGATTGTVQVVTPSGTLSSNVPFRVLP